MAMSLKQRFWQHNTTYVVLALVVLILCPLFGSESLSLKAVFSGVSDNLDADIFWQQRLPRVLLGFITGATLAAVGAVFQAIFRNPLATPYTLGVTGGATVGAYLAIAFPALAFTFGPFSTVQLMALVGAAVVLVLIYGVARRRQGVSMNVLLLAGVTIGIMCGALILLIRYVSHPNILVSLDRWTMGRLDIVGFGDLATLWPLLLPSWGLLVLQTRVLNQLSLGSDMASGHGVDVEQVQRLCFIGGSVATATVVSMAGPIGFVGLIIPHIVRSISGYDHRIVLPGAFCLGGAFLVLCDTLARTVLAPTEIPVGVITALIGGPFFVFLLLRKV